MVIMPTVDELTENTVMKNMRKLAQGVDNNFNDIQTSVDNAVETAKNAMEATEGFDDRITDNATAIENEVTARQNADEAETEARTKADITGIETTISSGAISVTLNRELGALSDSVTGPFIKTATLIPSATDRAFKLQFQYWDDTTYTTNDFVIPEGGGTDVSVSGVTVSEGDNANEFKVSIQLDDATSIDSNSYPFPESVTNPYPVSISGTLSGTTLTLTIGLNNSTNVTGTADLSAFLTKSEASSTYLSKTEAQNNYQPKGSYLTSIPIAGNSIGGVKNGGNVTIETDGTMNAEGGSGEWEEITFTNFPTNWTDDDIVIIRGGYNYMITNPPNNWNTAGDVSLNCNYGDHNNFAVLTSPGSSSNVNIETNEGTLLLMSFQMENPSNLNSGNKPKTIGTLKGWVFNGSTIVSNSLDFTTLELDTYIWIWRKRK